MNSAENLPILYVADFAVLGGSTRAAAAAVERARAGERVVLITRNAFLGEEVCAPLDYPPGTTPDAFLREQEEACLAAGVRLLYQCQYLDALPGPQGAQTLRLAGKFGLAGVTVRQVADLRLEFRERTYRAWMTRQEAPEETRILEVPVPEGADIPHRLLAARQGILDAYREKYAGGPWLLGRFALRGGEAVPTAPKSPAGNRVTHAILADTGPLTDGLYRTQPCSPELAGTEEKFCVVVAGGGTAGAMAAIAAARQGLRTALIEPNYALGGTATLGGVSAYWFGNRYCDTHWLDSRMESMPGTQAGLWGKADSWNPDVKATVLLEAALEAKVQIYFGHTAFGVWKEQGIVAGAAAAGAEGIRFLRCDYLLDATGDGDLAALAGADWEYGSGGDQLSYWASLAQYPNARDYRNNFSAMALASDPVDATRFTVTARKYGEGLFDHGSIPCFRESRHIRGQYQLTLRDLMTNAHHPDTLYTCFSNYDPKGKVTADAVYCGCLPQQTEIEIPLSCLLPVDGQGRPVEHLYVLGKAISASHDVFPSIRMQADLQHQGSILGSLIGRCVPLGIRPEQLPPDRLRSILLTLSDDPLSAQAEGTLTLAKSVAALGAHTRRHWVDMDFTQRETRFQPYPAILCADSREVLPMLARRLSQTAIQEERRAILRCQLWHGDSSHLAEFLGLLSQDLAGDTLPRRQGPCTCAQLLPDHGVMPEIVYDLNTLAWVPGEVSAPFRRVYALLQAAPRDYHSLEAGIFPYIESFAYVAARNGSPGVVDMTEALSYLPELTQAEQLPEKDIMKQRLLMLRYLLWRALAENGRAAGWRGLIHCLESPILPLRLSAETALCRLTGLPRGNTPGWWRDWMEQNAPHLPQGRVTEKIF